MNTAINIIEKSKSKRVPYTTDDISELFVNYLLSQKKNAAIEYVCELVVKTKEKSYYQWELCEIGYDISGEVFNTNEKLWNKISSIEDLYDAYTGEKTATYMSGCGWHHHTYEYYFREELECVIYSDFANDFVVANKELLVKVLDGMCGDSVEVINDYLSFNDLYDGRAIDLSFYALEFVKGIDFDMVAAIVEGKNDRS